MVLAFFFDINILTNVISLGTLLAFRYFLRLAHQTSSQLFLSLSLFLTLTYSLFFFQCVSMMFCFVCLGSMVCGGIVTLRYREPNENITFDLCTLANSLLCSSINNVRVWSFSHCSMLTAIDNVMNRNARVQICEPLARCLSKRVGPLVVCFFLASALFGVVANHFEKWKWPWWCPFIAVTPLVIVFCSLLILRLFFFLVRFLF